MAKLKSNIFSITILLLFCGWNIQSLFAQTVENKQFEIVVIIDGDLCRNISLCALKNGTSKEINVLDQKLGSLVVSEEDFSELIESDSIKVKCRFSSKKDLMAKYITFPIDKYFYDRDCGPLVNIYTLDDDRNKRRFKGFKRRFLHYYYLVYEIIICNFHRSFNGMQFHAIKY